MDFSAGVSEIVRIQMRVFVVPIASVSHSVMSELIDIVPQMLNRKVVLTRPRKSGAWTWSRLMWVLI